MQNHSRSRVTDHKIRCFDLAVSVAAIVFLSPVLALIAAIIRLDSPGTVMFRQERLGRYGRPFTIYKFRTMIAGTEKSGMGSLTSTDDPRITRIGGFLRGWSIDELPQVFNVVRGEMSLVGPRPAIVDYLLSYDAFQKRRMEVLPGLTGWAQVNGRNSLSWPEKIVHDVWYVDHRSLSLNLRIIARTFPVLVQRDGVYGDAKNFELLRQRSGGVEADAARKEELTVSA